MKNKKLPPKHAASNNPALTVERSERGVIDMPTFGYATNREAVIFDGHKPVSPDIDNLWKQLRGK